jgi:hypothetical protein
VDVVLADVVDDQLDRLLAVGGVEHHRLVQIHVFLRDSSVLHNQVKVRVLVLGVGFAQSNTEWTFVLELLRLDGTDELSYTTASGDTFAYEADVKETSQPCWTGVRSFFDKDAESVALFEWLERRTAHGAHTASFVWELACGSHCRSA